MSAYPPPTEDLPIFNPAVFFVDETGITLGEADARYLKLSGGVMTGTLAVPAITLNGDDVETDITALQTKTTDQSFSSSTTTFANNVKSTGGDIFVSGASKFIGVDNGVSSIKIKNSSNSGNIETVNPDNTLQFLIGGSNILKMTNAQNLFYQPLKANTSIDIGDATTRFNTIYASTLNLPTISDVASSITSNATNITTLTTKTTGISYDSGTTTTNITGKLATSDDITINQSNIEFLRSDGSVAGFINYQSEGLTLGEQRGGDNTSIVLGGEDIVFKTNNTTRITIAKAGTTTLTGTLALPNNSDVDTQLTTNTSNISTNTSNISTNTSNISTNTSNISTNTSNISTNTSNISTNTGNISTLITKTTQLSYDSGNTVSKFSSQLELQDTGDNTAGETDGAHQLRLTVSGDTDFKTMTLGYDGTADIGYINASKVGSTQPVCLQTRGGNVGVGLTNPSERLDVDATIKCVNLKTANHTDVDGSLTSINTKLTGVSYSSGNDETDIDTNSGNFKLSVQNQGVKLEGDPATTGNDVIPLQSQTKGGSIEIRMLNRLGTGNSQNYHLYTNNFSRPSGFSVIDTNYKAQKLELFQPDTGDSDSTSTACFWSFIKHNSSTGNPDTVGTVKFYYDGDIEANNVSHTSDKRLKENIIDAKKENLISDFEKVRFVNYNFIGKERKELGVIGQELKEIYPSLVVQRNNPKEDKTDDDLETYLSVKYGVLNMKGLMVIQELIKENNELKERLNKIEQVLNIN